MPNLSGAALRSTPTSNGDGRIDSRIDSYGSDTTGDGVIDTVVMADVVMERT